LGDSDLKKIRSVSGAARIKLEVLNAAVSLQSLPVSPRNGPMELAGISWQKTLISLQIGAVKLYTW